MARRRPSPTSANRATGCCTIGSRAAAGARPGCSRSPQDPAEAARATLPRAHWQIGAGPPLPPSGRAMPTASAAVSGSIHDRPSRSRRLSYLARRPENPNPRDAAPRRPRGQQRTHRPLLAHRPRHSGAAGPTGLGQQNRPPPGRRLARRIPRRPWLLLGQPALHEILCRGLARRGNSPTARWQIALGPEHRAPRRQGPGGPALVCRGRARKRLEPPRSGHPDRYARTRTARQGADELFADTTAGNL